MISANQNRKMSACNPFAVRWLLILLSVLGVFLVGTSAAALQSDWKGDPTIVEARLLSAVNGTDDLTTLPLALEFRLAPGWKIWRRHFMEDQPGYNAWGLGSLGSPVSKWMLYAQKL